MSWDRLPELFEQHPQWEKSLRTIEGIISESERSYFDPLEIAGRTQLDLGTVIAFLVLLEKVSVGRMELQILDEHGVPVKFTDEDGVLRVKSFEKKSDIPPVVKNEFGDEIEVTPQNTRLVFSLEVRRYEHQPTHA